MSLQGCSPQEVDDGIISVDVVDHEEEQEETNGDVIRVGEENFGFVDIPSDWVNFRDLGVTEPILQYSDLLGVSIITLNAWEKGEETVEDVATAIWIGMEEEGAIETEGAALELAGYDAIQVYGIYPDEGKVLVTWVFETQDGYMHYVAAESTVENIFEIVLSIEETFSLDQ